MVRQRESFNILMQQWDRVKELTEESANAAGTADEKYEAYMDSMEAATKRLQNAWESLSQSFEASPLIKGVTNLTALFAENAIEGIGWLKQLMPLLLTLQSGSIIGAITNPGETGGFRGLLSNIPIIGDFVKRNDAIQQIAKDVHEIKEETAGPASKTKNEGALKKIWRGLTGRQDIVDPETGKSISYKDAAAYRKLLRSTSGGTALTDPQMNQFAKLLTKRQIGNAAFGGIAAASAQLATTKEVGSGVGGWIGKLVTGNLGNEQTIEETTGDKALRVMASGGLAAVGGYFLGPLGAMLGQTLGEGFAGMFSTWFHRDELAMKQRVADAKENLNRLDALKSTMESNNSTMTEELTSSEDFEKLYKYTDDLYEKLFDLQYEGDVDIIGAFNHFANTVGNGRQIKTISDLCEKINNGNADQRAMIKRQLELAEAQTNLEELQASQEEKQAEISDALGGGIEFENFWTALWKDINLFTVDYVSYTDEIGKFFSNLGFTADWQAGTFGTNIIKSLDFIDKNLSIEEKIEKVQNLQKQIQETTIFSDNKKDILLSQIKEYLKNIDEETSELYKLNKQLVESRSNVGFLAADIHDLTTTELQDLTMDGVVGRVVTALEAQGVEVRNAADYIKDEYQDAIERLIKSDSKFNALQQASTKTLGQLTAAQERFTKATEDSVDNWDEWYDKARRGELCEEIAKVVYAANPERIEQFARAWNTTTERLEELTKKFPDLTTAIGLMSPSEVREYYSVFTDFFEDLATDSALTAENFEKLINQYPQLLKYYKQGGESLQSALLDKIDKEQMTAYGNALTTSFLSSEGFAKDFLETLKSDPSSFGKLWEQTSIGKHFVTATGEDSYQSFTYDELIEYIGSAKSLNEVLEIANKLQKSDNENLRNKGKLLKELVTEYFDYNQEIEWVNPLYEKAKQASIDYFQDQINNLEEQKNALSNVNDERQKEIDLIKARDALENARKEKKRVYRQGVGFVMEADEEAITAAQENLDKLNIEKQQEDIQYQIDQLEYLKSIVENLDEEKQKQANKEALKEYFGDDNPLGSDSALVSGIVEGFEKNRITFNVGTGEVRDAEGNVVATTSGISEVSKEQSKNYDKTLGKLSGNLDEFKNYYQKGWDSGFIKGTRGYSEKISKYNEDLGNLEKNLSAAEGAGVGENETAFKEAQDIVRGGKIKDVPYKLVDLDVSKKYGDINLKKARKGIVKLDPIAGNNGARHTADFTDYPNQNVVKTYRNGGWSDWESWEKKNKTAADVLSLPDFSIIANGEGRPEFCFIYKGNIYPIRDRAGNAKDYNPGSNFAAGVLSTSTDSMSLINELGTEAVITPGGTLTALPSKTGIVPADITKNVWTLGEVAPTLVAQLSSLTQRALSGNVGNTTYEEGQYFDNFTMNVYPTKDYDMDKLLSEARAKAKLTRHNN